MCLDSKCGRQHVFGHYKRPTVGGSKLDESFVAFTRQAPLLKLSVLDFNIDPHLTAHPTPNIISLLFLLRNYVSFTYK